MPARLGLLALFAASGAAGLILEVVWLRRLHLLFGSTGLAAAAVTAAFMAGLAAGSYYASRAGDRLARPLRVYGWLELGIGAYAPLVPALLSALLPVYRLGAESLGGVPVALDALRFGLALIVLVAPTTAMGATLPLLVRHLSTAAPAPFGRAGAGPPPGASVARATGALYAANTAGALAGVLLGGYVLLPGLGESATTWLAAACDLAVGAGAVAWAARLPARPGVLGADGNAPSPDQAPADPRLPAMLGAVALSGATATAVQVAFTRWLGSLVGSSVYAFTATVAAVLAGIAVGSALAARLPGRLAARPAACLAGALGGAALCLWLTLLLGNRWPWFAARAFAATDSYLFAQVLVAAGIVWPVSVLLGAAPPLAVRVLAPPPGAVSRLVGRVWLANTLGAGIGAALAGLVLLPVAGTRGTLAIGLVATASAGAVACGVSGVPRARALAAAGLGALIALAWATPAWVPRWHNIEPYVLGLGQHVPADWGEFRREHSERVARVTSHADGPTATVSVSEERVQTFLEINGKADASSVADMPTQVLAAHVPLLLHRAPRDVLIVGWGSGVTVGSAALHPDVRITAVEIEPLVVTAARAFDHVNHRPLERANVRVVTEDARALLATTRATWDVIISEPSNPWLAGPAKLFTRDALALGRARLRAGGVYAQWMQVYGLETAHLATILRTFASVFPDVRCFVTLDAGDLLLVGGSGAGPVDWADIDRRAAAPAIAEDLARVQSTGAAGLCSRCLADPEAIAAWAGPGPLNTDDNGWIEHRAPLSAFRPHVGAETWARLRELSADPGRLVPEDAPGGRGAALAAMAAAANARFDPDRGRRWSEHSLALAESPEALDALGAALRLAGDPAGATAAWRRALALDGGRSEIRRRLAEHLLVAGDFGGAAEVCTGARAESPALAALRGVALYAEQRLAEAYWLLRPLDAAWLARELPQTLIARGHAALAGDAPEVAIDAFERFLAIEPGRVDVREALARACRAAGRTDDASRLDAQLRDIVRAGQEVRPAIQYAGPGPARAALLESAARLDPFDPSLVADALKALRAEAGVAAGADAATWRTRALALGRATLPHHPVSLPIGSEHAYTCAWAATLTPDATEAAALRAESAATLRGLLERASNLPPLNRAELEGRLARLDGRDR